MSDIFGKRLGQYVLLEQLGEGGMAKVYNALDERIEKNVAIKVILPNKRSSQVFLQQFDIEAKSLANLTHTNIVKVLNYGTEDGQPYLVMEYVPGGTLKDAVSGSLPWAKAAEILAPIARALDYVHDHNIVHQDIKPSNILLDEDFRPMLSDFGVVKLLEAKEGENAAIGVGVGTPDYMSPEQGTGKDVDFRADIYSLGVVFYELVTGEKPFTADTPMALVIKHVTDEFPTASKANRQIPAFVERAIVRAVQKNPEDRYESMAQFADVLERIALGDQAPEKEIIKLTRRSRRRKNPVLGFALAALALVAVLAYFIETNFNALLLAANTLLGAQPIVAVYSTSIPVTATKVPTAAPIAAISPTPELITSPEPAATETSVPVQSPSVGVTLLETPISTAGQPGFTEIARWGIGGVNKVKWSPDGKTIALGTTSGIFLYDSTTRNLLRFINPGFNVVQLAYNPASSILAAGSPNGKVKLWDLASGLEQALDTGGEKSAVTCLSISKNGKNAVVGFKDGTFFVVSLAQRKLIMSGEQYPSVEAAFISADERILFVSNGEKKIFVWDIAAKKLIEEISSNINVSHLVPSADREFMLSSGASQVVYLWDLNRQPIQAVYGFSGLGSNVADMDFSPDGRQVVIGLNNGQIQFFDRPAEKDYSTARAARLTIETSVTKSRLQSLAFAPSGLQVASGSWLDGLNIWDVTTGENVFALGQSMAAITRLEFSPDAAWLATSHAGDVVRVWEVKSARKMYQFDGGYLTKGIAFSPDSRFLAIIKTKKANQDLAGIQILKLENGKVTEERTILSGYEPNSWLQFSDDSKLLVTGTLRKASIWDVSSWEKVDSHGEINAGCGQFFTPPPQNRRLAAISLVGILFSYTPTDAKTCGDPPKGTVFVYYFKKQQRELFVLGDGRVWSWDFVSQEISRIDLGHTYPNPSAVFLGANQESGLYASVDGPALYIRNVTGGASYTPIPGQDDYDYQVAFLPTQKMFALGSKYGSIHIWTLP
jgi:serine/threonine protein kinase/WD40 repeat protein